MLSTIFETDFGWVGLVRSPVGLRLTTLPRQKKEECLLAIWSETGETVSDDGVFGDLPQRLRAYFEGAPAQFPDIVDLGHETPFRQMVWQATRAIPYGEIRSYRWLAETVGRPGGARAIGQAMGANPVPIIVPCHRVIGSDGGLRGFGGGLDLKERMLRLEGSWR